jgi:subtilase family serine protease
MKRWNAIAGLASLLLLLAVIPAEPQLAEDRSGLERLLRRAVKAVNADNYAEALRLYRRLEQSSDPWYAWAGTSGRVVVHRMAGDGDSARAVTQRIAVDRAELAGLMQIWDGDTAFLEGDFGRALGAYRQAADLHGSQVVDGDPIGVTALTQLSRAQLERGDALTAAETERELLRSYPGFVDREQVVARILALEAMASGELPLKPLDRLLKDGDCSPKRPCVLGRGRVRRGRDVPTDAVPLAGLGGVYALNKPGITAMLVAPENMASDTLAATTSTAAACSTPVAKSGFRSTPMYSDSSAGYDFMETPDCCGGYHTGIDLNRGGYQQDCNDPIYNVANGCVRNVMSSTTDWGSAAVEHFYPPRTWTSQYGHAYEVYVSVGQAISKGAKLGIVGGTGSGGPDSFACHLHFEIREQDHTARNNASAYHNAPQKRVADEYQDPLPFLRAHRSYQRLLWRDENHFALTGNWTYVSGIGDEDDMRWAYTTPSKTTYARHTFSAPASGKWELWAFVPYANRSSTAVPYRLVRPSNGSILITTKVNQSNKKDAWVKIGTTLLTGNNTYYIEVATNTGESGRKVALDDFLLIQTSTTTSRADLKVSGITFTSTPKVGVRTTAVAQLSNVGTAASGGFNVKWYRNGVQVGYGYHASLAPGQVSNGNIRFYWTPTAGTHTLRFVADVDSQVTESSENNNSASKTVTVAQQKLADLKVSGITFTSTPKAGVPTTAVAQLSNVGQASSGGFNVKWYRNGIQVGYGYHASLAPGQVSNGNIRFYWTPTAGTHTLRFVADADGQVTESSENNNSASKTVTVGTQKLADLKVSGITFTSTPKAGVPTTAVAQLSNVGTAASGGFNVKWYRNGIQVGYGYHAPLAAGQVSTGNIRFYWTPTAGTHTLRFVADVDGQVTESSENNNSASKTVTVGTQALPDLKVSGITFTSTPKPFVKTTAVAQLSNVGTAASGGFNVKWYVDNMLVGYGYHAPLAAGQVSNGNIRFDWSPPPGTHTLRFVADVDGQVTESSESNNSGQVTVYVSY